MALIRKSIVAQFLIALFVGQMLVTHQNDLMVRAAYQSGMNPGMQVRLEQATVNAMKRSMEKFLPRYVNTDLNLPTEYHYEFGMFLNILSWKVDWTNITYSAVDLDVRDIKLNLTRGYDKGLLKFDFPAVKHWEIDANQEINSWILPSNSKVELIFKDFDIDFQTDFVLDENGYLDPVVYDVDIKFGKSYLYHDNKIMAFVMHQFIYFALVIIENSVYFVGDYIFSNMGGPILDEMLNHYQNHVMVPSPFNGQGTRSIFTFDFKNTRSPYIGDGYIDLYFLGELLYRPWGIKDGEHGSTFEACTLEPDYMSFMNSETFSQLVFSESAASCMLNSFSQAQIGRIHLNEDKINKLFSTDGIGYDSTYIAPQIPIFEEKLGENVPLQTYIHMKDAKVLFGQFDSDVIMEYTLVMQWFHNNREVLFDDLKMITSFDMTMKDDVMFIKLLNHKLDVDGRFGQKSQPIRNAMDLTENEYREFLSTYGFTMNYIKKWMNDVYFRDGIPFPYNINEFKTAVSFKEKSMHIMLEVEEEADVYFEDNYW